MSRRKKTTHEHFASEWTVYREILPLHKEQFIEWIQPLPLDFFKGKRFLDAGCGIGRNSLWPLRAGAASGVSFDFDERTVDVARFNLEDHPRCEVLYRSIYDIQYENEFDVVICIGVLQHLPDPRLALEKLSRALKPGGTLILWVYSQEGNKRYLLLFDPIRKYLTSRLPPRVTLTIARILTAALKIYIHLPHKNRYIMHLRERSFRHTEAVVYDQLLPPIANYWTKAEVLSLIKGLFLRPKHMTHTNGISWTLVAEKTPPDALSGDAATAASRARID